MLNITVFNCFHYLLNNFHNEFLKFAVLKLEKWLLKIGHAISELSVEL